MYSTFYLSMQYCNIDNLPKIMQNNKQNVMILSKKLSHLKCEAPVIYDLSLHIVDSIDFL